MPPLALALHAGFSSSSDFPLLLLSPILFLISSKIGVPRLQLGRLPVDKANMKQLHQHTRVSPQYFFSSSFPFIMVGCSSAQQLHSFSIPQLRYLIECGYLRNASGFQRPLQQEHHFDMAFLLLPLCYHRESCSQQK